MSSPAAPTIGDGGKWGKHMASRKKRPPPEPLALPGLEHVSPEGPPTYRVEAGSVPSRTIDAVLAGKADSLTGFTREQFDALMRSLVALRVEALGLPFDSFNGSTCATVRRALKTYKASELARAIRASEKDPFVLRRKPSLAAIFARVPEYLALAEDPVPRARMRTDVIADYLRLYPAAFEVDWWTSWPKPDDIGQHNTALIEKWIVELKNTIQKAKLQAAIKRRERT